MSRKLVLALLLLMVGLASWDAVLDNAPTEEDGQVHVSSDGTPWPL